MGMCLRAEYFWSGHCGVLKTSTWIPGQARNDSVRLPQLDYARLHRYAKHCGQEIRSDEWSEIATARLRDSQ